MDIELQKKNNLKSRRIINRKDAKMVSKSVILNPVNSRRPKKKIVQQEEFSSRNRTYSNSGINDEFFRTLAKGVLTKKRKAKKEDDVQILQV